VLWPRRHEQPETGNWDFGDGSTLFPPYLDGALVLGRIGHWQMVWRENDAWNVGFWALDDDGRDLDDVAGLIFERYWLVLETVTAGAGGLRRGSEEGWMRAGGRVQLDCAPISR